MMEQSSVPALLTQQYLPSGVKVNQSGALPVTILSESFFVPRS